MCNLCWTYSLYCGLLQSTNPSLFAWKEICICQASTPFWTSGTEMWEGCSREVLWSRSECRHHARLTHGLPRRVGRKTGGTARRKCVWTVSAWTCRFYTGMKQDAWFQVKYIQFWRTFSGAPFWSVFFVKDAEMQTAVLWPGLGLLKISRTWLSPSSRMNFKLGSLCLCHVLFVTLPMHSQT